MQGAGIGDLSTVTILRSRTSRKKTRSRLSKPSPGLDTVTCHRAGYGAKEIWRASKGEAPGFEFMRPPSPACRTHILYVTAVL